MTTLQRLRTGVSSTSPWIRAAVVCLVVAVAMFAAASLGRTSLAQTTPTPPPIESQFFYNAGAYALGGIATRVIDHPPSETLMTQGATILSRSGGQGATEVKDFHYNDLKRKDLVVIGYAKSTVSGIKDGTGCHVTTTESVVSNLSVDGRLKVASMALKTEARQCPENRYETVFKASGSVTGLTLDGVAVEAPFNERFTSEQSLKTIVAEHQKGSGWMPGPDDGILAFTSLLPGRTWQGTSTVFEDRLSLTSLLTKVGGSKLAALEEANPFKDIGKYALLPSNGIYVPNFGNVYFGQMLISRLERRASLLHLKLGSPFEAEMDAGGEFGNGSEFP